MIARRIGAAVLVSIEARQAAELRAPSARGKRKLDAEEIVARLSPRPYGPSVVRRLPPPNAEALSLTTPGGNEESTVRAALANRNNSATTFR
jgi:hypothetical protein